MSIPTSTTKLKWKNKNIYFMVTNCNDKITVSGK